MAPTAVSPSSIPFTTPSKVVAASLEKFTFETPTKAPVFTAKSKPDVEDEQEDADDASETDNIDLSRLRFVGDVDLAEKDEPLLKESKRRFVLFPIQYHEVRRVCSFWTRYLLFNYCCILDLDDVQKG